MITNISRDDLRTAIISQHPPIIFEALGVPYFRKGHLPGAVQLDYLKAIEQVSALNLPVDASIVVYCANAACANSKIAATALAEAGYENVQVYEEGKAGWQEAGLALER